ncbi:MAG: hypothetical protein NTW86_06770 [Candidatus Sumerlaeota bacterium]|nr:hypothetical protein [Candidatus Sumerlaeota bacterium]
MYATIRLLGHDVNLILLGMVVGLIFLSCSETLGGEEKPFRDLSAEEMKAALQDKKYLERLKKLPDEDRQVIANSGMIEYQSKMLAEQYFATTGEDRKRLAGIANASVARDVAYEIVKTLKLDPRMEPPPQGGKMDKAWLSKQLQGAYEGLFLVKPSDGKPLEQYHMVFGVAEGKRRIEKVEKDAAFDAAVYAQNIEKEKIVAWAETALKGSRENVLSHLPKAEYPYLNAPVFGRVEVDIEPLLPSSPPAAETAVSNWKGAIVLFFKPEASEFKMAETLLVEIEKKGDSITIVKCRRDEEFAEAMEEKVEAARFIIAYVSNPGGRAEWLAPGGLDELPKGATISPADQQSLALEVIEKRRFTRVMGDPGEGPLFEALCPLTLEGGERSRYRYLFRLVKPPGAKEPFLMLRVGEARPGS